MSSSSFKEFSQTRIIYSQPLISHRSSLSYKNLKPLPLKLNDPLNDFTLNSSPSTISCQKSPFSSLSISHKSSFHESPSKIYSYKSSSPIKPSLSSSVSSTLFTIEVSDRSNKFLNTFKFPIAKQGSNLLNGYVVKEKTNLISKKETKLARLPLKYKTINKKKIITSPEPFRTKTSKQISDYEVLAKYTNSFPERKEKFMQLLNNEPYIEYVNASKKSQSVGYHTNYLSKQQK